MRPEYFRQAAGSRIILHVLLGDIFFSLNPPFDVIVGYIHRVLVYAVVAAAFLTDVSAAASSVAAGDVSGAFAAAAAIVAAYFCCFSAAAVLDIVVAK